MLKLVEMLAMHSVSALSVAGHRNISILSIFLGMVFCLTLRLSGYQTDMLVYADAMSQLNVGLYYYREPYYWVGSGFLYRLLGDELVVFFVYDSVFCIALWAALSKAGVRGLYLLFLTSFPIYLGLENVYRQVLGLPFALLFLANLKTNSKLPAASWLLLAVSAHNLYAIFAPLFLYVGFSRKIRAHTSIVYLAQLAAFLLLVLIGSSAEVLGKSVPKDSGSDLAALYVAAVVLSILIPRLLLGQIDGFSTFVYAYTWTTLVISAFFLGSFHIERLGMAFLIALLFAYLLGKSLSTIQSRLQLFSAYYVVLNIPVFVFPSTRQFLVN